MRTESGAWYRGTCSRGNCKLAESIRQRFEVIKVLCRDGLPHEFQIKKELVRMVVEMLPVLKQYREEYIALR